MNVKKIIAIKVVAAVAKVVAKKSAKSASLWLMLFVQR